MSKRRNKIDTITLHEASVARLTHEGRGIAEINGKNTFLFGGLINEKVCFHYTQKKGRFDEGDVVEVLEASPHRVTPGCEHFSLCGGCSFQHAAHDLQLSHKQATLLEQFEHIGHLKIKPEHILKPVTGPLWGYRRKARLGVRHVVKKGKVLVGFRERNSAYLAELNHCKILDPKVGELITPLKELISALSVFDKIAQIEVAVDDRRAALVFRNLAPLSASDHDKLIAFGQQHDLWMYLQPGNDETVYKIYPEDTELLEYSIGEIHYKFHPLDFTQINAAINQKLILLALELLELKAEDKVLDLFCGLGNFSLPIALQAKLVVGVEGSSKMVERAKQNALLNQIHNTEFYSADLQANLNSEASWQDQHFDKILIDPPRTGAAELLSQISKWKAERVVYVSCNPATLARDAAILIEQGYKLIRTGIIDMFPHTTHVESIAVFERDK